MTKADLARLKPMSIARRIRLKLGLTQDEFCSRYLLPIGSVLDWEQGRSQMDASTVGYYVAIEADPEGVQRARAKARTAS